MARLLCANAAVMGGGWLTYVALLVGMLFEGWRGIEDARGRALTLAGVAVAAAVLYVVLTAYADGLDWTRASPRTGSRTPASTRSARAGVILHVAIGKRWPFG
jgi:hypothetical protein